MKNKFFNKKNKNLYLKSKIAFTLIELIVAITITSLVLVSIVEIFLFSNTFSKKVDVSRIMQENIKNFTEIIAEDIRVNWFSWAIDPWKLYYSWHTLITWKNEYYLANYDKTSWYYSEANYYKCKKFEKENRCILVVKSWSDITPLVNSWIAFEDLNFYVSSGTLDGKNWIPKVTMTFTIRPASWKWLGTKKIENQKIKFQTTFSERLYKYK